MGEISDERWQLGLSAARVGLRLSEQIDHVTSNILWINGAQLLPGQFYEEAAQTFSQAKERDASEIGPLMHQAWVELSRALQDSNPNTKATFEAALSALGASDHEHANFSSAQLTTARKIFANP